MSLQDSGWGEESAPPPPPPPPPGPPPLPPEGGAGGGWFTGGRLAAIVIAAVVVIGGAVGAVLALSGGKPKPPHTHPTVAFSSPPIITPTTAAPTSSSSGGNPPNSASDVNTLETLLPSAVTTSSCTAQSDGNFQTGEKAFVECTSVTGLSGVTFRARLFDSVGDLDAGFSAISGFKTLTPGTTKCPTVGGLDTYTVGSVTVGDIGCYQNSSNNFVLAWDRRDGPAPVFASVVINSGSTATPSSVVTWWESSGVLQ